MGFLESDAISWGLFRKVARSDAAVQRKSDDLSAFLGTTLKILSFHQLGLDKFLERFQSQKRLSSL